MSISNRVENIYQKIKIQGHITPAEYQLLIVDIHHRLAAIEEKVRCCETCDKQQETRRVEKPAKAGPRTRRIPTKKVSDKGIQEGAD